jgi:hypothetical protein
MAVFLDVYTFSGGGLVGGGHFGFLQSENINQHTVLGGAGHCHDGEILQ